HRRRLRTAYDSSGRESSGPRWNLGHPWPSAFVVEQDVTSESGASRGFPGPGRSVAERRPDPLHAPSRNPQPVPGISGFGQTSVTEFFDREATHGRCLLPDRSGVSGFGTYRKYQKAAAMMAEEKVERVLDVGCNRGSIEALFQSLYPSAVSTTRIDG